MKHLIVVLCVFLLSGCSLWTKTVEIETTVKPTPIAKAEKPKPVTMNDIKFKVVTKDNLDAFLEDLKNTQGEVVWFAITPRDYENLSLNINELRRYILQQKEVIIYYEKLLTEPK